MKERPILFSGPMVRAILEERKTQTRRVIAPQPQRVGDDCYRIMLGKQAHSGPENYMCREVLARFGKHYGYGGVGDRLWVRETWHCPRQLDGSHQREKLIYRSDEEWLTPAPDYSKIRWAPSIFMPRWASRITLEITSVRIERLEEINTDDLRAEGVQVPVSAPNRPLLRLTGKYPPTNYPPFNGSLEDIKKASAADWLRAEYASLWDSLNADRGYGWNTNPWVWVIEFKRIAQ